ncbi:MAG: tRNA 2-thiouridine(34) synthase MnmA [Candidatus Woesearchaeota archaeon]
MKIAVLVSGGVDSSVALALLQKQGHDVHAFYLKIWLEDDVSYLGTCPWQEDLEYVQKVCSQLHIPLKIINLQKHYWERVVSYAIAEVKQGRTPNPDMLCNATVKFDAFFDAIDDSFEKVATGHYADIEKTPHGYKLKRVRDPIKDQTYFLARMSQKQLARALFPLAPYTKQEIRQLAQTFQLPNKDRKDSQGICFLGKIKYSDFLEHYLGTKPGDIIDIDTQKKVGTHKGYWFYTLGQRRAIGEGLNHGPWYVVKKDAQKNIIYISNNYEQKQRNSFWVKNINWIPTQPPLTKLKVKLRHGKQIYSCTIKQENDEYFVQIDGNDQGIAPGQFAVFYDDFYCYGGGIIEEKD